VLFRSIGMSHPESQLQISWYKKNVGYGDAFLRGEVISLPELQASTASVALKEKAPSAFTAAASKTSQRLVQRLAAVSMTHKQPISEEQLFESKL